jgi:C1A family cysteine protease
MQKTNQRYGWRPDLPDGRDYKFSDSLRVVHRPLLPEKVDLRPQCPPVLDQSELGSCVGNSTANCHEFVQKKQREVFFPPSRLFIYYNARKREGTVRQDAGCQIRDAIKSIAKEGVCPEVLWPYDISKFTRKPAARCYAEALKHQCLQYLRIDSTKAGELESCLAAGYPFVCGIAVYDSFESEEVARTGRVPMPEPGERNLGGHAILIVGYDRPAGVFIAQNSWGEGWGISGFFTIPYPYLTNPDLAEDFWTIRIVE